MKKWIFILLLFPCLAWSGFSVDGVTDPASVDGVASPASVDGVSSGDPIAYDTANSGTSAASDTVTVAIDPTDGNSNKMLVIGVGWEDAVGDVAISALTYNSIDITGGLIADVLPHNVTYNGLSLYYMLAPDDVSRDIVVTMASAVEGLSLGAIVLYNVKQQAPEAIAEAVNSGGTASVEITTVTNNAWITDVVINDSSTTTNTPNDSSDERWTASASQTTDMSTFHQVALGAKTKSWTLSAIKQWGIIAAAWEVAD